MEILQPIQHKVLHMINWRKYRDLFWLSQLNDNASNSNNAAYLYNLLFFICVEINMLCPLNRGRWVLFYWNKTENYYGQLLLIIVPRSLYPNGGTSDSALVFEFPFLFACYFSEQIVLFIASPLFETLNIVFICFVGGLGLCINFNF